MKRIYVAGPYSCEARCKGPGVNLTSMKFGLEACLKVLNNGMAPFCPWLDYLFVLMDKNNELPPEWYYDYSNSFLVVCDAVWVIGMRHNSQGVMEEIKLAIQEDIPVFYDFDDVMKFKEGS